MPRPPRALLALGVLALVGAGLGAARWGADARRVALAGGAAAPSESAPAERARLSAPPGDEPLAPGAPAPPARQAVAAEVAAPEAEDRRRAARDDASLDLLVTPVRADDGSEFVGGLRDVRVSLVLALPGGASLARSYRSEQLERSHLEFTLDGAPPEGGVVELFVYLTDRELGAQWSGGGRFAVAGPSPCHLGSVPLRCDSAWLLGTLEPDEARPLGRARVEVMGASTFGADGPFVAEAEAPVDAEGAFRVPAPARALPHHARVRLLLGDGTPIEHRDRPRAFSSGVHFRSTRRGTLVGRVQLDGVSAAGLVAVHVEERCQALSGSAGPPEGGGAGARAGARVGASRVGPDGAFEVTDVPPGPLELVVTGARVSAELLRVPVAALRAGAQLDPRDVGTLELARRGDLLDLELVDSRGAPAAARLRWRTRDAGGVAGLGAAPLHRLLVPRDPGLFIEVLRAPELRPVPLVAPVGRVTVVTDR